MFNWIAVERSKNVFTSPITNHQSPITNHQSPITNHQSPITNHQSPITNHQSPITNHQSPITNHQSPITNHQSPITFSSQNEIKVKSQRVLKPNRYNPLKRNKGLSIIEALAAAFIGGVVLAGTGKMIAVSLHSSKTIQASTAEQSLIWSISKVLTNTIPCKANLKPSSGGISSTNGKGTVSTLIQGLGDPNVEDTTLVKVGGFKNTLEVVKMDFTGSGTGNPKTSTVIRDFIVYYKKKGVGTMEDKPCNSSNVEGCYFQGCSLKYKLENNASPNVEVCDVQNCAGLGENHIAGIKCPSGEYLKGFDSNGNKICEVLGECPPNQYLKGFDGSGNKVCLDRSTLIGSQICPSGQYLGGFDIGGIKVCHAVPPGPPGPRGPAGSPGTSVPTTTGRGTTGGGTTGIVPPSDPSTTTKAPPSKCAAGYLYSSSCKHCYKCNSDQKYSTTDCACKKITCNMAQSYDAKCRRCYRCNPDESWSKEACTCRKKCPGEHYSYQCKQCYKCPGNATWFTDTCTCKKSCTSGNYMGKGCLIGPTIHGGYSGTCRAHNGFSGIGSCRYQCQQGSWSKVFNNCK